MPGFQRMKEPSAFRKAAAAVWRAPNDPTVLASVDIDYSAAQDFVARYETVFGARLTPTVLVARATGLMLAKYPEANAVVGATGIRLRQGADIFLPIDSEDGRNMSGLKIEHADRRGLAEIATELAATAAAIRDNNDAVFGKRQDRMRRLPLWVLKRLVPALLVLAKRLGLDMSPNGPAPDPFGGAVVSSVAKFGLETAYASLIPAGQAVMIIAVMDIRRKPWVVGSEVVARPVLRLCCTSDHRIVDGALGGAMLAYLRDLLSAPERLLTEVERGVWGDPSGETPPEHSGAAGQRTGGRA